MTTPTPDLPELPDGGLDAPAVAPKVRTLAYWIALGTGAVGLLASGLARVWVPEIADQVTDTVSVVSSAVVLVTGGLGVAYRPTR